MRLFQVHADGICGNIIRDIHMIYVKETGFWTWQHQEIVLLAKGKPIILKEQSLFYDQITKTLKIHEGDTTDSNKLLVLTAYSHYRVLSGSITELPEFSRAGMLVLIINADSEIRISHNKKIISDMNGFLAVQPYKEEEQS
jgi:hypothetical protein